MKRISLLMAGFIAFWIPVQAQDAEAEEVKDDGVAEATYVRLEAVSDEALEFIETIESKSDNKYFEPMFGHELGHTTVDSLVREKHVEINEEEVKRKMAALDASTPFDLTYNEYVKAFINLYANKKAGLTSRSLGLAPYYFPMFEEHLDKHELPIEFKYLAVVESALHNKARSRVGAVGLWQFMYRTGKMYGLNVNSYVDDRNDIYKSTDAACRYFKDLYEIYGDWGLVIAAYNCGPGNVNKAIRRSGGKRTYWEIRDYLPRETRGYVPAFIAVNYVMTHHQDFDIVASAPNQGYFLYDTVMVTKAVDIDLVSRYHCIPKEQLEFLNPTYKLGLIPGHKNPVPLYLPQEYVGEYVSNEQYMLMYQKKEEEEVVAAKVKKAEQENMKFYHTVRSGEVLGKIAQRYRCSVWQIRSWNNLSSSRIYPGQKLIIRTGSPAMAKKSAPSKKEETKKVQPVEPTLTKGGYQYHVIKPGDTLWDIAKQYDGLTVSELKRLNQHLNFRKLKPGSKIKVPKMG